MAQNWLNVVQGRMPQNPWNIPAAELAALQAQVHEAAALLEQAQSSARTAVVTAACRAAFKALIVRMRLFKSHYFLIPPLTDEDYISLELRPRDTAHTPIPSPTAQAEADITRPGVHLLKLHLRPVSGSPPDPRRADYGYRIYYGVLPPGGAGMEAAAGAKRELLKVPAAGSELPHSRFIRRQKELFDFPAEDSGKTAYFCVRYENAKGEPGPWGPLFSSIIP
jgi:hypothetical protein